MQQILCQKGTAPSGRGTPGGFLSEKNIKLDELWIMGKEGLLGGWMNKKQWAASKIIEKERWLSGEKEYVDEGFPD